MELSCKNSQRLEAVNYFYKNAPSQMFDWVLRAPLSFMETIQALR